jgi:hypothetical protein
MHGDARNYLRPAALERGFGRFLVWLIRIGLVRGHFYVLEVRGRKSGRKFSLPVDLLDLDGRRYLEHDPKSLNQKNIPTHRVL